MNKKDKIIIKGARLNNLKNISVSIPKNKLIVVTGLSGSGKSSFAYDTIYAEAQRRYIESLSSYARQFLNNHQKPEFDTIKGLSPAIALEHKTSTNNPRSTVGTSTEIYHYLTLLFERLGRVISPASKQEVKPIQFEDFKQFIFKQKTNTKFIISSPIPVRKIAYLKEEGYSQMILNKKIIELNETSEDINNVNLVIDKLIVEKIDDFEFILKEAFNKAMNIGNGYLFVYNQDLELLKSFNDKMIEDNIQFESPSQELFNFNNPYGACTNCNGHGDVMDIDIDKVIPDKQKSLYDNAIHPWISSGMGKWKNTLIENLKKYNFPIYKKYKELSLKEKKIIWDGNKDIQGISDFFNFLKRKSYKIQYRVMLSKYRGLSSCKQCKGSRLNIATQYIYVNNKNIHHLVNLPIKELLKFIKKINVNNHDGKIITKIKEEITKRSESLIRLGLGYLTLNRKSSSLSGGESQRINIAKSIGSVLVGSIYVLDEPSLGLHSRDTKNLLHTLRELKDLGNTLIVVEHDKDIIQAADYIIDIGPLAGSKGGNIMYAGPFHSKKSNSITLQYINREKQITRFSNQRKPVNFIKINGIKKNNLKNINVEIPTKLFTAITGVSGSGKSTLIKDIFLPAVKRKLKDFSYAKPECNSIEMALYEDIEEINYVDQNSIKKSSKSTAITYINSYDSIRLLFASQSKSKLFNFSAKHFSFNVDGGRCNNCKGQGYVNIEMQFLADIKINCEVCNGTRFQEDILKVKFCNKNINQLLNLTIDEGYDFFNQNQQTTIAKKMQPLIEVGLGYLKMGQAINSMSSGELQRLKLGHFLSKQNKKSILIFDEPSKGLHFHDINILIKALDKLVDNGNTVIVVEHNLDIIKNVDWIIDMGPEAGDKGGQVIFNGTPKNLIKKNSHTGMALKKEINH
ncbi:MAG: excinuclease ABC subunit A [Flavobacteriales bacterium TMED191]|nr:MAG: excinuclease ABC subunit A [Flavobacteriales bacterium TMED191]